MYYSHFLLDVKYNFHTENEMINDGSPVCFSLHFLHATLEEALFLYQKLN